MRKIVSVSLTRLFVRELLSLAQLLVSIFKGSSAPFLPEKLVADLEEATADMQVAAGHKTNVTATEESKKYDGQRDDLILAIKGMVTSTRYRPEEAIRMAGKRIEEVIRRIGWDMHNQRNDVETSSINQLLSEVEGNPQLKADAKTVGIDVLLPQLKAANDAFNEVEMGRKAFRADSELAVKPNAERELIAALQNIFGYLNSVAGVYPEAEALIVTINKTVEPFATQLKTRGTIAENAKDKTTQN